MPRHLLRCRRATPILFAPRRSILLAIACLLTLTTAFAQQATAPVEITVDVSNPEGTLPRAWAFFGYDEPNFTYSANGKKLLHELAALSPVPVYVRTHNLLTSGDGKGSLKWGSTNAYSEDANGHPIYDWTVVDRIFDAYRDAGVRPLVEIGFTPEAMTTGPAPYRHSFPKGVSSLAGAIRPKTMQNGASWSSDSRNTCVSAMATPPSKPGSGRSGTSRTSTTGTERRRNISSSTTTPPQRCFGRRLLRA